MRVGGTIDNAHVGTVDAKNLTAVDDLRVIDGDAGADIEN